MVTLYNKSENNRFFLEKKMGIIVAIKSQRYLSTFCADCKTSNFAIFIITIYIFQKSMHYMNDIKYCYITNYV